MGYFPNKHLNNIQNNIHIHVFNMNIRKLEYFPENIVYYFKMKLIRTSLRVLCTKR